MANVFNSVKGLHPRRNKFSAHTYRNDFTGKLGLNIPVYQQHVTAGTRVNVNAAALVRLQALIAPVMDNIDYYVHFWKIPYRLIEDDRFTQFISGEIEEEEYTGIFATCAEFQAALITNINTKITTTAQGRLNVYNDLVGDGSLLDFCGYDKKLFGTAKISNSAIAVDTAGSQKKFNYRPVVAYLMLHYHWYMNENVPYYDGFDSNMKELTSDSDINRLCALIVENYIFCTNGCGMLPHGWDKDYFTSALPNVQYGDPVSFGFAGSAPVTLDMAQPLYFGHKLNAEESENYPLVGSLNENMSPNSNFDITISNRAAQASKNGYLETSDGDLLNGLYSNLGIRPAIGDTFEGVADLSEASAITINEFRLANALQIFKEREQRFGRRRQEFYKGFFDVTPEDLRLFVPKYLGGGRIPINISDVEQTSTTSGESRPLGSLAGKGTAVAGSFAGFTTFCSEESVIIGIAFAMPHITYAQATSKFLMKTNDRYDYFNPSFEHLGEQAIENIEIYSGASDPEGEFGYTPRFNEYRFHSNEMHGQFKSTLAYWSLGRIFTSQPALNADFIYMQPRVFNRIFAVDNQDNLVVSMIFHTRLIQPVSKYGTPGLMV